MRDFVGYGGKEPDITWPNGPRLAISVVVNFEAGGGPDMRKARAFLAGPRQGITYGANIWHHPLAILDRPAEFAVYMWLDGGKGDEEFFTLPETVTIAAQ